MHLDPISLNLFVAVVEEGPIAAAAGREHLAAAISRRMAELEQALGSPLRLHHARGIEPTAAGLALHVLDDIPVPLRDLATFAQAHPHVRILLEESNSPATVRAVAENAADVGVYTAFAHGDTVQSLPYR